MARTSKPSIFRNMDTFLSSKLSNLSQYPETAPSLPNARLASPPASRPHTPHQILAFNTMEVLKALASRLTTNSTPNQIPRATIEQELPSSPVPERPTGSSLINYQTPIGQTGPCPKFGLMRGGARRKNQFVASRSPQTPCPLAEDQLELAPAAPVAPVATVPPAVEQRQAVYLLYLQNLTNRPPEQYQAAYHQIHPSDIINAYGLGLLYTVIFIIALILAFRLPAIFL
ncbi:hypothetical protein M430DRAFT_23096 [Amorphotheca resinae ATCC 22711]|uniref:Uncharacterized protein n=1 Tax=Amorphotheca resinae ATCC 22711 TaxID=857342 RepID=A0A2T3APL2_AMORE|nr:hypothetical protein M430DRAFT_23096 [Amorphotheca resinae ATCC 22711]PSS06940.1 hypothetical protein M430DRAFT_23096 [Amorphotheca resinae ATCC 22711]